MIGVGFGSPLSLFDMNCWKCEKDYEYDGIRFCPDCQPWRPRIAGAKVMENRMPDGSYLSPGKRMSNSYINEVRGRKYKQSEETKQEILEGKRYIPLKHEPKIQVTKDVS